MKVYIDLTRQRCTEDWPFVLFAEAEDGYCVSRTIEATSEGLMLLEDFVEAAVGLGVAMRLHAAEEC